jgi:hypothetical protein
MIELCIDGRIGSDVGDYIPLHDCKVEVARSLLGPHLVLMTLAGHDNTPFKVHAGICDDRT